VLAVDGTELAASASNHATSSYEQIAAEILAEAGRIDAAEDELYGDARGDELPELLASRDGRGPGFARPRSAPSASGPQTRSRFSRALEAAFGLPRSPGLPTGARSGGRTATTRPTAAVG
jgi:hypothetical protein